MLILKIELSMQNLIYNIYYVQIVKLIKCIYTRKGMN